jgi:hypothetical protein
MPPPPPPHDKKSPKEGVTELNLDDDDGEDEEYDAESEIDRLKRLSGAWYYEEEDSHPPTNRRGIRGSGGGGDIDVDDDGWPREDALVKELKRQSKDKDLWGGVGKPIDAMAEILETQMRHSFMERTPPTTSSADSGSSSGSGSTMVSQRVPSTPLALSHSQAIPSPLPDDDDHDVGAHDTMTNEDDTFDDDNDNVELILTQKTVSNESSVSSRSSHSSSSNSLRSRPLPATLQKNNSSSLWEKTISLESDPLGSFSLEERNKISEARSITPVKSSINANSSKVSPARPTRSSSSKGTEGQDSVVDSARKKKSVSYRQN